MSEQTTQSPRPTWTQAKQHAATAMYDALASYPCNCRRAGKHRCRCGACGQYFNSPSTFDRHRIGQWADSGARRACLTLRGMFAKGWLLNAFGFWIERRRAASDSTPNAESPMGDGALPKAGDSAAQPISPPCVRCAAMRQWEAVELARTTTPTRARHEPDDRAA